MSEHDEREEIRYLKVRVQPKASSNTVVGAYGSALKVKVKAPPEKGRANRAARELLAAHLGVTQADIRLVRGARSRDKLFAVRGLKKIGSSKDLRG